MACPRGPSLVHQEELLQLRGEESGFLLRVPTNITEIPSRTVGGHRGEGCPLGREGDCD